MWLLPSARVSSCIGPCHVSFCDCLTSPAFFTALSLCNGLLSHRLRALDQCCRQQFAKYALDSASPSLSSFPIPGRDGPTVTAVPCLNDFPLALPVHAQRPLSVLWCPQTVLNPLQQMRASCVIIGNSALAFLIVMFVIV